MDALLRWCIEAHGLPPTVLEPALLDAPGGGGAQRLGFAASRAVEKGQVRALLPRFHALAWGPALDLLGLCSTALEPSW